RRLQDAHRGHRELRHGEGDVTTATQARQDAIDVVDGVLAVERNFHMAAREEAVQGELALGCRVVAAEPADQPVGSNTQYAQRLVQRRSRWRPRASIWPRWARSA